MLEVIELSNIEFLFIKALECVLFNFQAMRLKMPPVFPDLISVPFYKLNY
jgi:hypothetical protein